MGRRGPKPKPRHESLCQRCGNKFVVLERGEKKLRKRKYCSHSCASADRRTGRTLHAFTCRGCGTIFKRVERRGQLFCSQLCFAGWNGRQRKRHHVCIGCGVRFPHKRCSTVHKFCSRECYFRWKAARRKPSRALPRLPNCAQCGQPLSGSQRKYCSGRCATMFLWRMVRLRQYEPRVCLNCGSQFPPGSRRGLQTCSQRCRKQIRHAPLRRLQYSFLNLGMPEESQATLNLRRLWAANRRMEWKENQSARPAERIMISKSHATSSLG